MKNQSETVKNHENYLELYRVVIGGYWRLPGGNDHFSWLHHYIYITIINLVKDVTMYVDKSRLTGVHELRHALSAPLFVVFSFPIKDYHLPPIKDDQIDFLLSMRGVCLTKTLYKLSSHLCSTLCFYSCSLSVNLIIFISKLPKLRCDHIKLHDIYHQKHQLRLKMNIFFNWLFKRQLTVTVVFISHLLFGVIRYNLYSTVAIIIIMNT